MKKYEIIKSKVEPNRSKLWLTTEDGKPVIKKFSSLGWEIIGGNASDIEILRDAVLNLLESTGDNASDIEVLRSVILNLLESIENLTDMAPEDLDTLKEIADSFNALSTKIDNLPVQLDFQRKADRLVFVLKDAEGNITFTKDLREATDTMSGAFTANLKQLLDNSLTKTLSNLSAEGQEVINDLIDNKIVEINNLLYIETETVDENSYVDLGLPSGLLWATCNVGAENPLDPGSYFAWGETEGYAGDAGHNFAWANYKWSVGGSSSNFSKYNSTGATLDLEDDAAHVNLGGSWRMPTKTEIEELINNTTRTWTTNYEGTGKAGYIVKSKTNSNQIFMPAAGCCNGTTLCNFGEDGRYWSSSQYSDYSNYGYRLYFYSGNFSRNYYYRYNGCSVRGVTKDIPSKKELVPLKDFIQTALNTKADKETLVNYVTKTELSILLGNIETVLNNILNN